MRKIIPFLLCMIAITACTSIECPLNNSVYATFVLKGETDTLADTLTVYAMRRSASDTILYNRGVNTTSFSIPVSYAQEEDLLLIETIDTMTKSVTLDTIAIKKTNDPHFEAVDCNPAIFHTVLGITTTYNAIDSLVINDYIIDNNETKEHFYIYFTPRSH